jgi:hypothetical protein
MLCRGDLQRGCHGVSGAEMVNQQESCEEEENQ